MWSRLALSVPLLPLALFHQKALSAPWLLSSPEILSVPVLLEALLVRSIRLGPLECRLQAIQLLLPCKHRAQMLSLTEGKAADPRPRPQATCRFR